MATPKKTQSSTAKTSKSPKMTYDVSDLLNTVTGGCPQDLAAAQAKCKELSQLCLDRDRLILARDNEIKQVTDTYAATIEERVSKSILQAAEANSIALRKEYGDSFSKTAVLASNALNKLAAEAGVTLDVFDTPEMRSNPAIFKIFAHVGKMMQESGFVVNGVPLNNVDPQAELNAIYKDPSHKLYKAFYDSSDPMFHEANRRVDELMEQVRKAK